MLRKSTAQKSVAYSLSTLRKSVNLTLFSFSTFIYKNRGITIYQNDHHCLWLIEIISWTFTAFFHSSCVHCKRDVIETYLKINRWRHNILQTFFTINIAINVKQHDILLQRVQTAFSAAIDSMYGVFTRKRGEGVSLEAWWERTKQHQRRTYAVVRRHFKSTGFRYVVM